jgi:thiol-disulfide isomerase/thioredoxin
MTTVRGAWCVVVSLAALASVPAAQDIGLPLGTVPPAVTIEDLDGSPVDLGRWMGKQPVLVEFWATWCPVCEALFPKLEAAHRRYGERVTFLVVAVAVNQSPRSIRRHLERHPMPFATVLWDRGGEAVRAFDAFTTSYVVVLDAAGKVAYTGAGENQDIDGALRALLSSR